MQRQLTPQAKALIVISQDDNEQPTTFMIRTEDGHVVWLTKDKAVELAEKILKAAGKTGPVALPASRLVQ